MEIIRGFDEEYRRGDFEAIFHRYHPEIEVRDLFGGVHKSRDAALESLVSGFGSGRGSAPRLRRSSISTTTEPS